MRERTARGRPSKVLIILGEKARGNPARVGPSPATSAVRPILNSITSNYIREPIKEKKRGTKESQTNATCAGRSSRAKPTSASTRGFTLGRSGTAAVFVGRRLPKQAPARCTRESTTKGMLRSLYVRRGARGGQGKLWRVKMTSAHSVQRLLKLHKTKKHEKVLKMERSTPQTMLSLNMRML